MDEQRFDALTRRMATRRSRRTLLAGFAGGLSSLLAFRSAGASVSRKKALVCHLDQTTEIFSPLEVNVRAVRSHLRHGDILPGTYSPDIWKACGISCTNCLDYFTAQGYDLHSYQVWCNGGVCDIQCTGNSDLQECPANDLFPNGFNGCAQCCEDNDCAERFSGILNPPDNSYWICGDDYQCDIACNGMLQRCTYESGKNIWYYCAECCEAADCPQVEHATANCLDIEIAGGIHPGQCEQLCDIGYETCDPDLTYASCCPVCSPPETLQICNDDFIGCGNCCTGEDCAGTLPAYAFWTCAEGTDVSGLVVGRYCRAACPEGYKTCTGPTKAVAVCCPPVEHGTAECQHLTDGTITCNASCEAPYQPCLGLDGTVGCCLMPASEGETEPEDDETETGAPGCAEEFILCPDGSGSCTPDPALGCPADHVLCVDGSGGTFCCLEDAAAECPEGSHPCPCGLGACCAAA